MMHVPKRRRLVVARAMMRMGGAHQLMAVTIKMRMGNTNLRTKIWPSLSLQHGDAVESGAVEPGVAGLAAVAIGVAEGIVAEGVDGGMVISGVGGCGLSS